MKKITLLFSLLAFASYGQEVTSYTHSYVPETNNSVSSQEFVITNKESNSDQAIVETFTTVEALNKALVENCADITLTSENFSGGPSDITTCDEVISSNGGACFPSGEIEEGFSATSSELENPPAMVNIPPGAIGNVDSLIGAGFFSEFTIINFEEGVYAAAFDIWENIDPSTEIRFFNVDGDLMESLSVDIPLNAQTFFGFYGNELVGKIEIEGASNSGELFGNFLFGADCSNLSIQDQNLAGVSISPNPARDLIQVTTPNATIVESLTLIDLNGKVVSSNKDVTTFDLSQVGRGLYLLQINTTEGTITKKIVKQ